MLGQETIKEAIIKNVKEALQEVALEAGDFRVRKKQATLAHEKVLYGIKAAWAKTSGFGTDGVFCDTQDGIDIVGRRSAATQIYLVLEIDRGKAGGSWRKLADKNAIAKVWVYIDEKSYPDYFEECLKDIRLYFMNYKANPGEFIVFHKSPDGLLENRVSL